MLAQVPREGGSDDGRLTHAAPRTVRLEAEELLALRRPFLVGELHIARDLGGGLAQSDGLVLVLAEQEHDDYCRSPFDEFNSGIPPLPVSPRPPPPAAAAANLFGFFLTFFRVS